MVGLGGPIGSSETGSAAKGSGTNLSGFRGEGGSREVVGGSGAGNTSALMGGGVPEISGPDSVAISAGPHLGRKRSKYQNAPSQMSDASGTDQPTPLLKPPSSSM